MKPAVPLAIPKRLTALPVVFGGFSYGCRDVQGPERARADGTSQNFAAFDLLELRAPEWKMY